MAALLGGLGGAPAPPAAPAPVGPRAVPHQFQRCGTRLVGVDASWDHVHVDGACGIVKGFPDFVWKNAASIMLHTRIVQVLCRQSAHREGRCAGALRASSTLILPSPPADAPQQVLPSPTGRPSQPQPMCPSPSTFIHTAVKCMILHACMEQHV